jgi:hypothetical protein
MSNLLTQAEYSKLKGFHRSYATQLKDKGLLVKKGKFVDVKATDAKIAQFKDPAKQPVADRHAENRANGAAGNQENNGHQLETLNSKAGNVYQTSRALNEKYKALSAQLDYELKIGKALDAQDVANAIASAAVVIRTRLESLPDISAAQLAAETDENKIKAYLLDQVETLLSELSRQFSKSISN